MGDLSERCMALFHDVKLMEEENARLSNALAKRDSEIFALKAKRLDDITSNGMTVSVPLIAETLVANKTKDKGNWEFVAVKPKLGALEDDVRKFLGMPPFEGHVRKNDKNFIASLDKAYGQAQVDAMIKQLRGA